ncbi:MAG: glycosyltransferase [Flavobacteriaceae bacterium]|nr:glycosyltransferase [Flavobacteriaceae bacterium]
MQKLLIIASVWVEPNSSASGSRMLQLIELFLSDYNITYASTATKSNFSFDLSKIGVHCVTIKVNDISFDKFITKLKPEIVLFDRFILEEQFGWRVTENLPNTFKILDTEDLHCLRKTREIALKENRTFKETDLLKTEIAKREIASILRSDLSLIISTYEMKLLTNLFKVTNSILHHTPFLLNSLKESTLNKLPTFEQRKNFYFIGNFLHKPNIDCVLFLKNEIWSKITAQIPHVELHIYGAYMPEKIKQLHNTKDKFLIKNRANDLPNIIQKSKICLAPLRFGAGLKGKFLEAMQHGTPSITTTIGAEAMHHNLEWSGDIANTINTIVNASIKLYTNKMEWLKAQKNGLQIINQCYDKKYHSKILLQKIHQIKIDLKYHRQQNFIGELLQHHTLRSTKYLSKWIEEKTKKR